MRERIHTYDVVVIGAGLSGLMAALGARSRGAEVAILAEGGGAVELSSGSIDLFSGPWSALERLDGHPYHLVGTAGVHDALAAFASTCRAAGLPYTDAGDNQRVVTAVGSLRPTYLPAPGAAILPPEGLVRILGFRGLKEFHPGVVAEGLRRSAPHVQVTWDWVDLPPETVHPLQVARLLEEPAYRGLVTRQLAAAIGPTKPDLVLLPGVLGLDRAVAVRAEISSALGAPAGEVPLLSPSLPGLRLGSALARQVQRAGADLHLGARATGARSDRGRVEAVTCQTAAGAAEYRAGAFVLATGGLLGHGLEARDRTVFETIFGLPVELPADAWASPELLSSAGHAFVRAGVRSDSELRPAGWSNLHICGKMLAGYDPYAEGSGGGVAIATGWKAGLLAGGAVK